MSIDAHPDIQIRSMERGLARGCRVGAFFVVARVKEPADECASDSQNPMPNGIAFSPDAKKAYMCVSSCLQFLSLADEMPCLALTLYARHIII